MQAVGGQEILMSALTQKESWEKTERAGLDILFHLKSRQGSDFVLNPTHEEVITPLMKKYIASYRDLPAALYQFQTKFRDEPRAKSGLLRTREFLMKDLYSFHSSKEDLDRYYEKVKAAYFRIFKRVGLAKQTVLTFASGGSFSKYSHEFQALCEVGEDDIFLCEKCKVAVNGEIIKEQKTCPQCGNAKLVVKKAVEVGNIFKLGAKFSQYFGLTFKDIKGKDNFVEMGCYGIGPARVMGVLAEIFHDSKGLSWPKEAAPFQAHLLAVEMEPIVVKQAEKIYNQLVKQGVEVLYDDRNDVSAGEKFADADLIGAPLRLVVSKKTLEQKAMEVKKRNSQKISLLKISQLAEQLFRG
jgi:prolyl-tRNA synthetase